MECFEYQGKLTDKGYARISIGGRKYYLHRAMLQHKLGRVLEPTELACHICDNRKCCNPHHLEVGTLFDNMQQMHERGRAGKAKKRRRLKPEEVALIKLYLSLGQGCYQLCNTFVCGESTIRAIKNGYTWREIKIAPKPKFEYDPFADE